MSTEKAVENKSWAERLNAHTEKMREQHKAQASESVQVQMSASWIVFYIALFVLIRELANLALPEYKNILAGFVVVVISVLFESKAGLKYKTSMKGFVSLVNHAVFVLVSYVALFFLFMYLVTAFYKGYWYGADLMLKGTVFFPALIIAAMYWRWFRRKKVIAQ